MSALLNYQIVSSIDTIQATMRYLDLAIADKGFIADGSYSDLRLIDAEKRLREAADLVRSRREMLLANAPVLEAAE